MAIIHSLTKKLDNYILNVSQDSTYNLYYVSDNSNSLLITDTLLADSEVVLSTNKDGKYKIVISAENETDVTLYFNVIKYLQNSITNDALNLLCILEDCKCKTLTNNCLSNAGKKCLTHKSVFVKLLSYQSLYVPVYGTTYTLAFNTFLEKGVAIYNCKAQTVLNNILQEECITGSVKSVDKLFNLYLALYWAGMYFIDKTLAGVDEEELAFVKAKYAYDKIVSCLCSTCIDITELESIFVINPVASTEFIAFQYDDISYTIDDIALLTPLYLEDNGEVVPLVDAESGRNYSYSTVARIGFVITNVASGTYEVRDILNNIVTDVVFDITYNAETLTETYISKEFVTPSSIYFKFIKL